MTDDYTPNVPSVRIEVDYEGSSLHAVKMTYLTDAQLADIVFLINTWFSDRATKIAVASSKPS